MRRTQGFRIDRVLERKITKRAGDLGVSRSALCRQIITDALHDVVVEPLDHPSLSLEPFNGHDESLGTTG